MTEHTILCVNNFVWTEVEILPMSFKREYISQFKDTIHFPFSYEKLQT